MGDYIDLLQASSHIADPLHEAMANLRAIFHQKTQDAEERRRFDESLAETKRVHDKQIEESTANIEAAKAAMKRGDYQLAFDSLKTKADLKESEARVEGFRRQGKESDIRASILKRGEAHRLETQPLEDERLKAQTEHEQALAAQERANAERIPKDTADKHRKAKIDFIREEYNSGNISRKKYEQGMRANGVNVGSNDEMTGDERTNLGKAKRSAMNRLEQETASYAELLKGDTNETSKGADALAKKVNDYRESIRDRVMSEEFNMFRDSVGTDTARHTAESSFRELGMGKGRVDPGAQTGGPADQQEAIPAQNGVPVQPGMKSHGRIPFTNTPVFPSSNDPRLMQNQPGYNEAVQKYAQKRGMVGPANGAQPRMNKYGAPAPATQDRMRMEQAMRPAPQRPPDVIDMMQQEQTQPKLSPDQIKLILNQAFGGGQ